MSAQDPREELSQVIELCQLGLIPAAGGEWAGSAYGTTEAILDTIDSMQSDGIDAPTPRQEQALFNIYQAACNWLDPGHAVHSPKPPRPSDRAAPPPRVGAVRNGSTVRLSDGTAYVVGRDCSIGSPVAQALIGHVAGETVVAVLPRGDSVTMTIESVT